MSFLARQEARITEAFAHLCFRCGRGSAELLEHKTWPFAETTLFEGGTSSSFWVAGSNSPMGGDNQTSSFQI